MHNVAASSKMCATWLARLSNRWWTSCVWTWTRSWRETRSCPSWTTGPTPCRQEPHSLRAAPPNSRTSTGGKTARWECLFRGTCVLHREDHRLSGILVSCREVKALGHFYWLNVYFSTRLLKNRALKQISAPFAHQLYNATANAH